MNSPTQGSGPAPARAEPAPETTSRLHAAEYPEPTAGHCQDAAEDGEVPPPFPYGRDWPDTDQWLDRDGTVFTGEGPYLNRPLRRLRRALRRWWFR